MRQTAGALEVEDFDTAVATLREHNVLMIIGPLELPACQAESDEPSLRDAARCADAANPLPLAAMATVRDPDGNKLTLHRRKQY